jgi:hypothetical protein
VPHPAVGNHRRDPLMKYLLLIYSEPGIESRLSEAEQNTMMSD